MAVVTGCANTPRIESIHDTAIPSERGCIGRGARCGAEPISKRCASWLASRRARSSRGFDIHAGVSVSADDREGRERLLRYCARPPLSPSSASACSRTAASSRC
jgi:hypothetical protein